MRTAGAAVKEMLLQAGANRWKVSVTDCFAKEGFIINRVSNAKLSYGELVQEASKLPVPQKPRLKTWSEFTQLGKKSFRPDVTSKVDGTAILVWTLNYQGCYMRALCIPLRFMVR
jgi:isoquinoline 1-oxidoreductase beta subunit